MNSYYIEYIQDLLITIHQNIRELKERKNFAEPEERAHIDGKLMAYNEILSAMRMGADEFNIPRHDIGL